MEKLVKTIFPPKCIVCGRYGRSMCHRCLSGCKKIDIGRCIVCQEPSVGGETHAACFNSGVPNTLFSSFEYEGSVRECIRRAKYNSMEFDALKDLTMEGLRYAWKAGIFYSEMLVVPIPLSPKRIKFRGFNQAEVIARKVAEFYKLKTDFRLLKRTKETLPLSELSRAERLKEMKSVFVARPEFVAGKKILLVDDVCTTGSTLISCSQSLMAAEAVEVQCFTVAAVL